MAKEKKFITCDGNEAAARLRQWRSMSTSGLHVVVRTCGVRPSVFRKCSLRLVQLVLFTVLCRLVPSPRPSLLLRVCS